MQVADFRVVNNKPHKLANGEQVTFPCEIPPNVYRGGRQPQNAIVIKYFLEGASALRWEFYLNGTRLIESTGSGSDLTTTLEAFDANLLLPGENQFEIKVTHGLGAVRIADIVVHYHVTV